jgi:uncharacterized protein (DUF1015 family)
MAEVRPFVGLLYDPAVAGPIDTLTSPPYDVISPEDQQRFHSAGRYNVVRLILGREHPAGLGRGDKYTRAASLLRSWRDVGVLNPTPGPCVYPYELLFSVGEERRSVRGVILEVALEPWGGSIMPHERTMPGPARDRMRLLRAVRANLSPVYGMLPDRPGRSPLAPIIEAATRRRPRFELTDESGTIHRLWVSEGLPPEVVDGLRGEAIMIADGHHRYEVALAHRDHMRARHGPGPWDGIMMLVVDAVSEDPPVLPIHRVLSGPNPFSMTGRRATDLAEILAAVEDETLTCGMIARPDGGAIYQVVSLSGVPPTVCALHEGVLDHRGSGAVRFVPDPADAEAEVLDGRASAAIILPSTTVGRVWDLVRAGRTLPQKSTFFWPKPRTGMVIRPFDP